MNIDCCTGPDWKPLMDLGESGSFDFTLGRCASCGRHVMHVWRMGDEEYLEVKPEDVERFLHAHQGPDLKELLNDWFWGR